MSRRDEKEQNDRINRPCSKTRHKMNKRSASSFDAPRRARSNTPFKVADETYCKPETTSDARQGIRSSSTETPTCSEAFWWMWRSTAQQHITDLRYLSDGTYTHLCSSNEDVVHIVS